MTQPGSLPMVGPSASGKTFGLAAATQIPTGPGRHTIAIAIRHRLSCRAERKRSRDIWPRVWRVVHSRPDVWDPKRIVSRLGTLSARPSALVEMTSRRNDDGGITLNASHCSPLAVSRPAAADAGGFGSGLQSQPGRRRPLRCTPAAPRGRNLCRWRGCTARA